MPYLSTSQEWMKQSSLLLQARPTTTKISTKYTVLRPEDSKARKRQAAGTDVAASTTADKPVSAQVPAGPKATLTLRTYDPESGVCLKYQTNKAAEVGRLIASLGRLGRTMAALQEVAEDTPMPDALPTEQATGTSTPAPEPVGKDAKNTTSEPKAGKGSGGRKKKKGKK